MSNCLIWALWRWFRDGGYLIVRKSRYGWWPHFLWSRDLLMIEQFVPRIPNHHRRIPPLLFDGYVKLGDD